jgi:hypothetical protein
MNLLERKIKKMRPGYLTRFDTLVKRFSQFGGGAEADKYIGGHGFSNAYEFYTFAFFIGLYAQRSMDLSPHDKLEDFWEIENWKPFVLTDQLIACAIAESDFDMIGIENFDESEIVSEVRKIKNTIESFANGGFQIIQDIIEENPGAVASDDFFIKMLAMSP